MLAHAWWARGDPIPVFPHGAKHSLCSWPLGWPSADFQLPATFPLKINFWLNFYHCLSEFIIFQVSFRANALQEKSLKHALLYGASPNFLFWIFNPGQKTNATSENDAKYEKVDFIGLVLRVLFTDFGIILRCLRYMLYLAVILISSADSAGTGLHTSHYYEKWWCERWKMNFFIIFRIHQIWYQNWSGIIKIMKIH